MDATPQPEFIPCDTGSQVPVPDIGPDNSGGPPDESGGFVKPAEETTLAPKERKKPTLATKAMKAKQLPTITENSNNKSVPLVSKKAPMPSKPFVILEESDSNRFGPLRGILKLKARWNATKYESSDAAESDNDSLPLPPSKKLRIVENNSDVNMEPVVTEKPDKKQKGGICKAIEAIQESQPATSTDYDNQVNEKHRVVGAEENLEKSWVVVTASDGLSKHFGDGPVWKQQEKGGKDAVVDKHPNQLQGNAMYVIIFLVDNHYYANSWSYNTILLDT